MAASTPPPPHFIGLEITGLAMSRYVSERQIFMGEVDISILLETLRSVQ